MATAESISKGGAKPVFPEIDPRMGTLHAQEIKAKITPWMKALMPVHL
ncbi:DegT/DnrJ/EryC1/StrS family aminotransferase [Laspinema olomoucense]|uniref:DegT/DnrJ/EryC1/StrS family aminotransferase n=1 Tax=Laspinema olomoucense D3b TaxID=2953688 RepID=A0ABT2N6N1_9CYAN|nr:MULTISPECIES: DegT/DnrJ/EryC1/StrS family aminotransferase [unclassified Laspinema]MCT7977385.1 DegT/DnrJ/EryC1/StrS family aminotransferase [Laspinema sp. D3b]MCT7986804.1 DegT/DnrJ/EryC1/StrS family aminotransferase [Laspinema sp. D3a]